MSNDEKQHFARLTEDEILFIEAFRSLAESKKQQIIETVEKYEYKEQNAPTEDF